MLQGGIIHGKIRVPVHAKMYFLKLQKEINHRFKALLQPTEIRISPTIESVLVRDFAS